MIVHSIFFYFFSIIAIFSSLMVITSRSTINSVFFLILDFISVGCLFIMVGAEFLGMILLIVYVGAVAVLFLFVVMMLDIKYRELQMSKLYFPVGILIGITMLVEIYGAFTKVFSKDTNFSFQDHNSYLNWYENLDSLPDVYVFGQVFYTQYVLQILIAGLILYLAAIAVAFLTVKTAFNRVNVREQSISKQLSRKNVL